MSASALTLQSSGLNGEETISTRHIPISTQRNLKSMRSSKDLEAQKLKDDMDRVADAYSKTGSLKRAAEIAHVSSDTVEYWYDWGMRGFGEENTYFYKKIMSMKK